MILVLADSCGGELDAQFLAFLAAAFCLELAVLGGPGGHEQEDNLRCYEDRYGDCRVDPELRRVEADQGASYGEFPVALREEHLVEGGKQPFPTEDAHNAEHRDESQGNPCAGKEAAADGAGGALAQGDAANERQQEECGNGYGGDEQYPFHVVHVVHFCFCEGEGVVGTGGDSGEVFARREVVDVVHAVGAQAHPLDEVVAVAVFGESGAVVFEPEEGRGGYSADCDHEYGQRYGERDEGCAELEEARGVFHGVFAGCGAFCSFG